MTTTEKTYAWCSACGEYVYRTPGQRHGDGQVDTDETPVWLLTNEQAVRDAGIDPDTVPHVNCGCNA